jgi:hypothetical protein
LLNHYIRAQEPGVEPILITWSSDKSNWLKKLTGWGYNSKGPNVIMIDEAQLSYGDSAFWNNYLKGISDRSVDRVILFASYGSPNQRIFVEGTTWIPDPNRISLRPVDHRDGIAEAGLFLLEDEFTEMVGKLYPASRFEKEFLDYVFRVTAGHAGAAGDLLQVVSADDVRLRIKLQHSLIIISSHTVDSSMSAGTIQWKPLEANSLLRSSGWVSIRVVYSGVASPSLMNSGTHGSLEFFVKSFATIVWWMKCCIPTRIGRPFNTASKWVGYTQLRTERTLYTSSQPTFICCSSNTSSGQGPKMLGLIPPAPGRG